MNIDFKNPFISSLFGMSITLVIFIILLYCTKPKYIMKLGKKKINMYLLIIYSLLYSIIVGIVILLYMTRDESQKPAFSFNQTAFNPHTK